MGSARSSHAKTQKVLWIWLGSWRSQCHSEEFGATLYESPGAAHGAVVFRVPADALTPEQVRAHYQTMKAVAVREDAEVCMTAAAGALLRKHKVP